MGGSFRGFFRFWGSFPGAWENDPRAPLGKNPPQTFFPAPLGGEPHLFGFFSVVFGLGSGVFQALALGGLVKIFLEKNPFGGLGKGGVVEPN